MERWVDDFCGSCRFTITLYSQVTMTSVEDQEESVQELFLEDSFYLEMDETSPLDDQEEDDDDDLFDYDAWEARLCTVTTGVQLWDLLLQLSKTRHARGRGSVISFFFNTLRTVPLSGDSRHCQYMAGLLRSGGTKGKKCSKRSLAYSKMKKSEMEALKQLI